MLLKNYRRIKLLVFISLLVLCWLSGCAANANYSDNGYGKVIDRLNSVTSSQHDVDITTNIPIEESKSVTTTESAFSSKINAEELFDIMYSNLSEYNTQFTIDGDIETNDIEPVVKTIFFYHPEIFWITGGYEAHNSKGSHLDISFEIKSEYSIEEYKAMSVVLNLKADEIINAVDSAWSEYDKVLFIHDYLIDQTDYNYEDAAVDNEIGISSTAYGCLINRSAVCSGYSSAFVLLMNKLGIESGTVTGIAKNEHHAWNYVKVNGNYYWLDVTWDDPEIAEYKDKYLRHAYFLINDDMLNRSRIIEKAYMSDLLVDNPVPECNSLDDNWYVHNNCYFETYSFAQIDNLFSANPDKTLVTMMFGSKEAFDACLYDLFEVDVGNSKKVYSLNVIDGRHARAQHTTRDDLYVLDLEYIIL